MSKIEEIITNHGLSATTRIGMGTIESCIMRLARDIVEACAELADAESAQRIRGLTSLR